MSFGGGFFGGGEKKTTTQTQTTTISKDLRTGIEGGVSGGAVLGPSATLGLPGSVTTAVGDYSTMNQTITGNKFRAGLSGAEVNSLLQQQTSLAESALARMGDFASSSLAAATTARTGELPNWQKYIPLAIGALALVAIWRKSR